MPKASLISAKLSPESGFSLNELGYSKTHRCSARARSPLRHAWQREALLVPGVDDHAELPPHTAGDRCAAADGQQHRAALGPRDRAGEKDEWNCMARDVECGSRPAQDAARQRADSLAPCSGHIGAPQNEIQRDER